MKKLDGSSFADLMIPSFSKDTPIDSIKIALEQIAVKIDADEIVLYCSKEAKEASYSTSYSEKHPDAANCLLGKYKDGVFEMYP